METPNLKNLRPLLLEEKKVWNMPEADCQQLRAKLRYKKFRE